MGFTNVELLDFFQFQPQNPHFWWIDQTKHPQEQNHPRGDLVGIAKRLNGLVLVESAISDQEATPKFGKKK
jgi:hypothetical protein